MTAQIYQFSDYRPKDLISRMEAINREALHLCEASMLLVMTAIEMQMVMLGMKAEE